MAPLLPEIMQVLEAEGVNLTGLGLAWARTTPLVVLVPAFGMRALPAPARVVVALAFAASIMPAAGLVTTSHTPRAPWVLLVLGELLHGLPVAVATAVPLWAATMTGDLMDAFRGGEPSRISSPVVEGQASPIGVLLSMLASAIWLGTGGPARAVSALVGAVGEHPVLQAAHTIVNGITLAISLGAPIVVVSVVLEIGLALITRAAAPAQVTALIAPLRSFAILGAIALVIDRIARVLANHLQ
jgi:type III secretory pathway component EscT